MATCCLCGHTAADHADGVMGARINDDWYCHEDDHSCYQQVTISTSPIIAFEEWVQTTSSRVKFAYGPHLHEFDAENSSMDDTTLDDDQVRAEALTDLRAALTHSREQAQISHAQAATPAWRLYWTTRLQLLHVASASLPTDADQLG